MNGKCIETHWNSKLCSEDWGRKEYQTELYGSDVSVEKNHAIREILSALSFPDSIRTE